MSELRAILVEKEREAREMLEILAYVSGKPGSVMKASIMKSSQIMLLYNAIESMMYLTLERMHEKASHHDYKDLSGCFKKIWAEFYFSSSPDGKHSDHLVNTLNGSINIPPLDEFLRRVKLFSGNLDARKLNEILRRYGVRTVSGPETVRLKLVKEKRNALAHGECMFKEGCRGVTGEELTRLTTSVFTFLRNLVKNVEEFVDQKKYLQEH